MSNPSPSWVIFAHLIIDDLHLPDGSRVEGRLGGAGTYAALGAALVSTGRTALVSGVGRDLSHSDRDWLTRWNIDTTGLVVRGERTPRSLIRYRPDGSRTETPLLGEKHFLGMDPTVPDLPADRDAVRGLYFFAGHDAWQWSALSDWTSDRAAVLWEISADSCHAEAFTAVGDRLPDVDMLSINRAEAQALCGLADPVACVQKLRDAGARLVVLRMGARGALLADGERILTTPAAPVKAVVDPTGAGNCYSGAFLAAYCETGSLELAAGRAAVAASAVLGHYGVPPPP
jgi:sugar/nucleoside kinase (ribokinase family)